MTTVQCTSCGVIAKGSEQLDTEFFTTLCFAEDQYTRFEVLG